jgi:hypothetical protein
VSDRWFLFWKIVFWAVIWTLSLAAVLMLGYGAYLTTLR